jgi:hypothetical protein
VLAASLSRDHAELLHLRENVNNPPDLSDPAVDEPHDEDLAVRDGSARWRDTVEFTQVGSGNCVLLDDFVAFFNQIVDRKVNVGEGFGRSPRTAP